GHRFKITDFGIGGVAARQALEELTRPAAQAQTRLASVRGACTPLYASPQQLRGEAPDVRDDVYSLGVSWDQMLTGDLSAAAADWRDELAGRDVTEAQVQLLGECLASRPDRRPADAGVLAARLATLLQEKRTAAERVEAMPAGPGAGVAEVRSDTPADARLT